MLAAVFSETDATIVVALIAGLASIAGLIITAKTRKENTSQHAASVEALGQVATKVDAVGSKIDQHIGWHSGHDGSTTTVLIDNTRPAPDSTP